jgi:hypothetical protein
MRFTSATIAIIATVSAFVPVTTEAQKVSNCMLTAYSCLYLKPRRNQVHTTGFFLHNICYHAKIYILVTQH